MLPVKAHTEVLAELILAGSYQNNRADFETTSSTRLCPMRPTLNDIYRDGVKQHTNFKGQLNFNEYQNALKSIERDMVYTQLNKDHTQPETPLPKIAEEKTLQRIAHNRIAQPRTGFCPLLDSYLRKICDNGDNRCPKCDAAPHDVNHISNCSINPMEP